jgi:hypothetical protein
MIFSIRRNPGSFFHPHDGNSLSYRVKKLTVFADEAISLFRQGYTALALRTG